MTTANGFAGLAERLVRVLERLADPRVLVTALIVMGAGFYWYSFRLHDAKLDALLIWTTQKSAFDLLDCIRESESPKMERLCAQAARGEPIDLSRLLDAREP